MSTSLSRLPGSAPVTWAVILANGVTFLLAFVGAGGWLGLLVFRTWALSTAPWTVLTYPLVAAGQHPLGLLLGAYVLWLFGGSLERGWGRRDYLVFLALTAAVSALALSLGAGVLGRGVILAGLWLPLAAATVAWAALHPYEQLLLYFVLPIQARWLGIGAAVLLFFVYPFPLGAFALAGPAVAYWYVRGGRSALAAVGRPPAREAVRPRRRRPTLNPLAWYARWRLKRRFLRMMRETDLQDRE